MVYKCWYINIRGVDWTTLKLNYSNQQMPCRNNFWKSLVVSAMIVWIEDVSHTFRRLCYCHTCKFLQFLLMHLLLQMHHVVELVESANLDSHQVDSVINPGNCWWGIEDQHSAQETILCITCVSDRTHLTNSSCDQHTWLWNLIIGNMWKYIHLAPKRHTRIVVWLMSCPPPGVDNTDQVWYYMVWTVLSLHSIFEIRYPGKKRNSADWLQRQSHPLLAACVADNLEQVMVAQVSYGSNLMCSIANGVPLGHSTCCALDISPDHHDQLQLLEDTNIDALHTDGVHTICNQFRQYPLCNP